MALLGPKCFEKIGFDKTKGKRALGERALKVNGSVGASGAAQPTATVCLGGNGLFGWVRRLCWRMNME